MLQANSPDSMAKAAASFSVSLQKLTMRGRLSTPLKKL